MLQTRGDRMALLLLIGTALRYAVLGLWILRPDAVYSGDIGVMQPWRDHP